MKRRVVQARDALEWSTAQTLLRRSPWCRNRWGYIYQALSFGEYHYLRDGNPETHEARFLERVLTPGMTVVDVGANHGLFSLEAGHFVGPGGRIDAFEPAPGTLEILRLNLRANGLEELVRIFPQALGAAAGWARLRIHHMRPGLNTLAAEDIRWNRTRLAADDVVEVPVTTLDDHAAAEGLDTIDFLKIDVEGFETFVLQGARRLLGRKAIRWIMLEVGDVTCANAGVAPESVLQELGSHGYELCEIDALGRLGRQVRCFPNGSFSANYVGHPA